MLIFRGERVLSAGVALLGVSLAAGLVPGGARLALAQSGTDAQIEANVHKTLSNKKFQNVTISVHDGNVTLGGSVVLYRDKEDADIRTQHVADVKGIDNEIKVGGSTVDDATLRAKLADELAYNRVGYGTTAFDAITIAVHNGVVTLGGSVYWQPDADSAVSLVANTPGVKDVIDNIGIEPLSPMDDRLRLELERVIYGTPELQKYAVNPAKPIRIVVANGDVTLAGAVDSEADREIAGLRANGVPGVFKVTNDLQVEGQKNGK